VSDTLASAMPRQATGSVETHHWRDGRTVTFRVRFRAYGRRWRIDFGTNHEGWNQERARVELERIIGQVARGTWEPPSPSAPIELDRDETLHVTASRWWQRREGELAENTRLDYRWRLDHVLRHLARASTAELDAHRVDDFRQKLHARGLSARSVNMVLDVLAQVLDDAVEYGVLDANPARGRRRRMKVAKSRRTFLEPDQVVDLLDVAGEWERELPPHQQYGRRALLATLCLAGPRISELTTAPRAAGSPRRPPARRRGQDRGRTARHRADVLPPGRASRAPRASDRAGPAGIGGRADLPDLPRRAAQREQRS
jgi:hypothetical protein